MRRLTSLFTICIACLSCSSPVLAAAHHKKHRHHSEYLSMARAYSKMIEPGVNIRACRRDRRNAVTCIEEYEGTFEIEPSSGSWAKVQMSAILCKDYIFVIATDPAGANCKSAVESPNPIIVVDKKILLK